VFSLLDASLAFPLPVSIWWLLYYVRESFYFLLVLRVAGWCYDLVSVPLTIFLVLFR
jgi:hypothetical protein